MLVTPHLPGVQILSEDAVLKVLDLLKYVSITGVRSILTSIVAVSQLTSLLIPLQTWTVHIQSWILWHWFIDG